MHTALVAWSRLIDSWRWCSDGRKSIFIDCFICSIHSRNKRLLDRPERNIYEMGANSTTYQQNGNPVLLTYLGFPVQPYWLIIAQLLIIQFLQRLFSRIMCKKIHRVKLSIYLLKFWFWAKMIQVRNCTFINVVKTRVAALSIIWSLLSDDIN